LTTMRSCSGRKFMTEILLSRFACGSDLRPARKEIWNRGTILQEGFSEKLALG